MNPLISVIIPCYNCSSFLEEAIDSVLAQTFTNYEIIIIDDGSTDNSYALMQKYSSDKLKIVRQQNKGVSTARNAGIKVASGHYFYFLDADDVLHPEGFKKLIDTASLSPISIGFMKVARFKDNIKNIVKIDDICDHFWPTIIHTNLAPPIAFLFPAGLVHKVGGFDERISFGEDWDFLMRLAFLGAKLAPVDFVGAYYRLHEKSTCKTYHRPKRLLGYIFLKENLCKGISQQPSLLKKYGQEAFWSAWGTLIEAKRLSIPAEKWKSLAKSLRKLAWNLVLIRKATPFIFLYTLAGTNLVRFSKG